MKTIFGIRHHGPGCARSLLGALDALAPDLILLEMPQEVEPLLVHASHMDMTPPVALLVHRVDAPENASFYPFAEYSPEWQAIRWSLAQGVPVRCFDLPSAHMFALREEETEEPLVGGDPFDWFAKADGYGDGERWWNDRVEERGNRVEFFEAILEAVTTLRGDLGLKESRKTLIREAWMRKSLRAAEKDGYSNIAVICGAWHAPVIGAPVKVSDDNALLKGLAKHKVAATWIPWTDERLTMASGYGAGIRSPGWYGHLWRNEEDPVSTWLTRAARIMREEGQEASSASVIEAVRLSRSLAGIRGRPAPGLDETLEAMCSIFCRGDALPLDLLNRKLLVGERLGELPEGISSLPLQQDIEATQKRLRLKPTASVSPLELDLREEGGRARSVFLHRLLALDVEWGSKQDVRSRGTFKERWALQWKPTMVVAIIDASMHGNTVETAATNLLVRTLKRGAGPAELASRLDLSLLAALPAAAGVLLRKLDEAGAASHDLAEILEAVPALARICRYGDVRATDAESVGDLLHAFAARVHVGLLAAGSGIDEDAAARLSKSIREYGSALSLFNDDGLTRDFHLTLSRMSDATAVHPGLRGLAVRILRDGSVLATDDVRRHLQFSLSAGMPSSEAAAWLEGFLRGGGRMLVHDHVLLGLVDDWLMSLGGEEFQAVLPLLRRTFGSFTVPERARIASSATQGGGLKPAPALSPDLDIDLAMPALSAVAKLLGLQLP